MNKALHQVGEYVMLMGKCISVPNRWSMFFKQLIKEIYKLGVDSLWIVVIISIFIGTVIAIQISLNISSPLIPKFTIGYTTREIILLEFSSSIMSLILAGKVGSNIASEIGTMRVTEQIDAMEIMGVNSANFLILAVPGNSCSSQLPDPAKDGRYDDFHSGISYLQYVHRYFGRYRSQPFHRNRYDTRFFRIWFTVLFQ